MSLPGHTCVTPPSMSCCACMDLYASDEDVYVDPADLSHNRESEGEKP